MEAPFTHINMNKRLKFNLHGHVFGVMILIS